LPDPAVLDNAKLCLGIRGNKIYMAAFAKNNGPPNLQPEKIFVSMLQGFPLGAILHYEFFAFVRPKVCKMPTFTVSCVFLGLN
jgi:hypothetical protein